MRTSSQDDICLLSLVSSAKLSVASLGLTVGGVVAGIVGAGTSVTAGIVKDSNIRSDKKELEEALKKFENQEEIINNLLEGVYESLNKLSYLMKKGPSRSTGTNDIKGRRLQKLTWTHNSQISHNLVIF